jgi:pre-rRNA-processing protein TSR1
MGEQTWPTEEELMMAGGPEGEAEAGDRNAGRDRRVLKADQLVPKGMSSYQADWFMDEEGELDFTSSGAKGAAAAGAGAGAGAEEGEGDGSSIGDECEEFTLGGGTVSGKKSVAGSGFNSRGVAYTLKERQELDEAFPDEMDTPDDVSARLRFARYRALQSFRASPWHPKENLPQDYARIFQFENFGGTQRR